MYFNVNLIERIVNDCPKDDRELRYFLRYKRYLNEKVYYRLIQSMHVKDLDYIKTVHVSSISDLNNQKDSIFILSTIKLVSFELKTDKGKIYNLEWDQKSYNSPVKIYLYVSDKKRYSVENMNILVEYLKLYFNISDRDVQMLLIMDKYIRQEISIDEINLETKMIKANIIGKPIIFTKDENYCINIGEVNKIHCKDIDEVRDSLYKKGYDCNTLIRELINLK